MNLIDFDFDRMLDYIGALVIALGGFCRRFDVPDQWEAHVSPAGHLTAVTASFGFYAKALNSWWPIRLKFTLDLKGYLHWEEV